MKLPMARRSGILRIPGQRLTRGVPRVGLGVFSVFPPRPRCLRGERGAVA